MKTDISSKEKKSLLTQYIPLQTIQELSSSFEKGNTKPAKPPSFTSGGTSCPDVGADISYTVRQFANIWVDSHAFSTVGITTGFNSVQGAIAAKKAYDRVKNAWKVGDLWGTSEGALDCLRGITQSAGGMAYAGLRPLSIIADLKHIDTSSINAATSLGKSTFMLGTLGNIFFGFFYLFLGACTGVNIFKTATFKHQLNKSKDLKEAMQFLSKKLHVDPGKTYQKLSKHKDMQQDLEKAAVECVSDWMRSFVDDAKLLKAAGMTFFGSYNDRKAFVKKFFAEIEKGNPTNKKEFLEKLGFNEKDHKEVFEAAKNWNLFELVGLKQTLNKTQMRKELKIARATSGECVKWIKTAEQSKLFERLTSSDKKINAAAQQEMQGILEKIKTSISSNLFINSIYFVSSVVGVVATILMFFFTGGIGAIVVAALFLIVCVTMMLGDGYGLFLGLQDGEPGKYDKKLVVVNTVVCVISIAVVIALMATGVASLVLGFVSLGIALAWLASNGVTFVKLDKKEKKYFTEHPTLENFFELLQQAADENDYNKVSIVFKKLSKNDRTALKGILEENTGKSIKKNRLFKNFIEASFDRDHNFGEEFFKAHPFDHEVISAVEKCMNIKPSKELSQFFAYLTAKDRDVQAAVQYFDHLEYADREAIKKAIYMSRTQNRYFKEIDAVKIQALKKAVQVRINCLEKQTRLQKEQTEKYENALRIILSRKLKND
jgi:hypothetical protein